MWNQDNKFKSRHILSVFLGVAFLLCFAHTTNAATLSILPSSTSVSVGNIVTVKVFVNTQGRSINNAEATIQFPTDLLDIISITKSSSIFSLWVEEPNFSNNTGTIIFNGGVPNPGYIGGSGYIASVTFKAQKRGTASILFTDGAVRENDGLGTDILTSKSGSVLQINPAEVNEIPTKTEIPVKNVTKSTSISNKIFTPTIRFEGNQGIVRLSDQETITNIDYYTLAIDNASTFKVKKEQLINYEYYLPIQNEGSHSLNIISFDNTGKYTESVLTYKSPAISTPVISLNTYEITTNDSVVISGKTDYPSSKVNVVLELNNNEIKRYAQTTGIDGSFSITTDKINKIGIINIWAENVLSDTVKSIPSEKVYLKVNETAVIKITVSILYPLLWLIIIFTIISLLLVLLYLGWHKFFGLRRKFEDRTKQAAIEVHKAMLLLKEELSSQLETLENVKKERNLNEKEEIIFKEIQKNIDGLDVFIEKKLKKIL